MTREEVLRTLNEIEEQVEQIEKVLHKRSAVMHKAHYSRLWKKKEAVMARMSQLEEGAEFLLSAGPAYKMVQSF
ncbi:hypothetical protein [Bacillus badius]|uniref:Uncharacterized protein n=1 Tax=Bacillus badius TaxID=1455 RepID=A0ABR5AYW2_BACBA|nr:hypothetical protein [Bacillus badius]KIL75093.1 hypothetical protein SD78_2162 [Bacillus badius]KIL79924.1 hypothetical protein SD77_2378 [Bacillus badius]KZR60205.1 hypothetical protein A3781_08435 [Bacillus badius]MED4715004.1 hypothetical protein [Bacillus badius]